MSTRRGVRTALLLDFSPLRLFKIRFKVRGWDVVQCRGRGGMSLRRGVRREAAPALWPLFPRPRATRPTSGFLHSSLCSCSIVIVALIVLAAHCLGLTVEHNGSCSNVLLCQLGCIGSYLTSVYSGHWALKTEH